MAAAAGTPLRTPLRDELAINSTEDAESVMGGSTPGSVRSATQVCPRSSHDALARTWPGCLTAARVYVHWWCDTGVDAAAAAEPAGCSAQATQRV
jgi:hypothetical protein